MDLDTEIRSRRKAEHLEAVRRLGDYESYEWFRDITLMPNCAPETAWDEVSLETDLCGIQLSSPIIINAMTGGTPEAYEINRKLAAVARRFGLAMAVGSEAAALENSVFEKTYTVVREMNPDGVFIANVGMNSSPDFAGQAIDLINAQLLQVHWNVAQELFMAEGDRDFRGALENLTATTATVRVPVIAKEVGQGIAGPEAEKFMNAGVSAIDVGGKGGTNFIAVEALRQKHSLSDEWKEWGIPTPVAVCEVLAATQKKVDIVASGGIRTGHDIVKTMAIGAKAVGIAGPLLRLLSQPDGEKALESYIDELHWTLRSLLVLTGSQSWTELRKRPLVVSGKMREWLLARGQKKFLKRLGRRDRVLYGAKAVGLDNPIGNTLVDSPS